METIKEIFTLNAFQITRVLVFLGLFALFTLFLSIFLAAIGWKIFEKAGRNVKEAFIPVYNLVVLLQIAEIPSYYFFTLLVPVLNIILLIFVQYKLGKLFKVSKSFMVGLILCPLVFIPILAFGDKIYKEPEEEVFISVSDEMPTILSQEQIEELNRLEMKEPKVDNIFRTEIKKREYAGTYKAGKVDVNEEFVNENVPQRETIKKMAPVKALDIERAKKAKYIDEEKIEILEL